MAREVWPDDALIAASEEVVLLAVHRSDDQEWATRLNVMAYPRILFLDGWARILEEQVSRRAPNIIDAIQAHRDNTRWKRPRPKVPSLLGRRVDSARRKASRDPVLERRVAVWRELLAEGEWSSRELAALFEWEPDAPLRMDVLEKLAGCSGDDRAVVQVIEAALEQPNDYVRAAAMELAAELGGPQMAGLLGGVMELVLEGRSSYANPNNMLCEAAKLAQRIADPSLAPLLQRILEQETANNSATMYAVEALLAIGLRHGLEVVREGLEAGLEVEGDERRREWVRARAREALDELDG